MQVFVDLLDKPSQRFKYGRRRSSVSMAFPDHVTIDPLRKGAQTPVRTLGGAMK